MAGSGSNIAHIWTPLIIIADSSGSQSLAKLIQVVVDAVNDYNRRGDVYSYPASTIALPASSPVLPVSPQPMFNGRVITANLRVRNAPSVTIGTILRTISNGTPIAIWEVRQVDSSEWWRINDNEWIAARVPLLGILAIRE